MQQEIGWDVALAHATGNRLGCCTRAQWSICSTHPPGQVVGVIIAELQEALHAGAAVVWALAIIAVGQQQHQAGVLPPLLLPGADELVNDHLAAAAAAAGQVRAGTLQADGVPACTMVVNEHLAAAATGQVRAGTLQADGIPACKMVVNDHLAAAATGRDGCGGWPPWEDRRGWNELPKAWAATGCARA
jgi:hypothetical protein